MSGFFLLGSKRYKVIEEEIETVVNRRLSAHLAKRK